MPLKAGDKLPAIDMYEGDPDTKVNLSTLKGKIVIFGIPGAFTPTCNNDHAPGFVKNADALKKKGVKDIVCIGVNDPFVMTAWGKSLGGEGKVRFLSDTFGEFIKKTDMVMDLTSVLGSVRSKRYFLVAEDGVIKTIKIEPDGIGHTCSRAQDLMSIV